MNPFATRSKVGSGEPVGDEREEVVLDYQQLVWSDEGRQLPPGVNAAKLEAHLSDPQFEQVLGMGRAEFYQMSKVEQDTFISENMGMYKGRSFEEWRAKIEEIGFVPKGGSNKVTQ